MTEKQKEAKYDIEVLVPIVEDLEKLYKRYALKRQKEIDKIKAKYEKHGGMTEEEIADAYGYGDITDDERVALLEGSCDNLIEKPTLVKSRLEEMGRIVGSVKRDLREAQWWVLTDEERASAEDFRQKMHKKVRGKLC